MKKLTEKQKMFIIYIFVVLFIIGVFLGTFLGLSRKNREEQEKKNETKSEEVAEELESISIEDSINKGYFVIDTANNKIYNKDVLDRFIENTSINSKNRIEDKIKIVNYNMDGAPTIYDLEYKTLDKTYINEEQKEVHSTGYILTTDTRRTTYEDLNPSHPHSIVINDDIPGSVYGINLIETPDINNAVIIELSLYAEIQYVSGAKIYEPIEITRYSKDSEIINNYRTTEEIKKYENEVKKIENEITEKLENQI